MGRSTGPPNPLAARSCEELKAIMESTRSPLLPRFLGDARRSRRLGETHFEPPSPGAVA